MRHLKHKAKRLSNKTSLSQKRLILFIVLFAIIGGILLIRSFALNPNLPGDVNNDNVVNITDLSILLSNYGTNHAPADFNSDGVVNILDLSILLTNYGRTYSAPAPTLTFTANPTSVSSGSTTTLSWSSTNATSCNATGAWSGSKATSGSQVSTAITSTSTFTLTCTGAGGSILQNVTVNVNTGSSFAVKPQPPRQGYSIPAGAVAVSNASGLSSALASANRDIVLENGTYSFGSYINANNKRLYARNYGQAIVNAGIDLSGGGPAGQLYGIKVNITSSGHIAPNSGAVTTWSAGAVLQDVEINGNNIPYYGLSGYNPHNLIIERVVVRNVLSDGLRMSTNFAGSEVITRIWDVYVDGARGAPIYEGTGESGIWIGHRVAEGVKRIEVYRAGWMGVWTGNVATNFVIEDVTIANIGPRASIGIYPEHNTTFVTFRKLDIDVANSGINVEWWYDGGGSSNLIIEDFKIRSGIGAPFAGIFFDAGSFGNVVRRGTITVTGNGDGVGYPTGNLCGSPVTSVETSTVIYQGSGLITRGHSRATGGC